MFECLEAVILHRQAIENLARLLLQPLI